jgi:ribosome-binding protein aMBF1 (putative translation factor)
MKCELCSREAKYEVTFYDGTIAHLCEEHYKIISQEYNDEISYANEMSKRILRFSIRGE